MKDSLSISLITSSADYSNSSVVYSTPKNDSSDEEKVRRLAIEFLFNAKREYNEHVRVEVWLNRENGISQLIFEKEK